MNSPVRKIVVRIPRRESASRITTAPRSDEPPSNDTSTSRRSDGPLVKSGAAGPLGGRGRGAGWLATTFGVGGASGAGAGADDEKDFAPEIGASAAPAIGASPERLIAPTR